VEADAQILVNPAGYMNVKNIQGVSAIYTDFTTHVFRANSGASTFAKLTTAGLRLGDGATATAKLDVIGTGKFSSTVTAPTFIGALTGNAATATTASNASLLNSISAVNLFNNMGDVHSTRTAFDATTPTYGYGWRYVQGTTNGPATGGTQYYSQYVGLGSQYPATGAGSYGMQVAYSRNVANPYIAIRYNESNALGAWSKISAGKADTLTTARAINGVNFDGSAPITITANANLAGNLLTAVPSGAVFTDTNTTYSVGDGGLSQINFTSADHTKLNGIATSANNYVRPSSETQYIVTAGNSNGIGFWQNISAYAIQMGNNQANHGTVTDYSMHHNMGTNAGRGFTFGSSRTAVSASINALTGSANFNGSVGIGTAAAPGAKLEVYGGQLRINTADGLYARTEHAHAGTKVWSVGTQGNATDYQIYRESGAGNVIINSGNVGIGTTTPLFGLHHKGTSNAPSLSSAAGIAAFETSSSAELTMGGYTSSPYGFWLQTKDSGAGGVGSGSSYPLLLNPLGGNIGIGTTSATYKLVVDDDASSGKGLHVLGGGGGGTLARFERNVGSSGCLVDINCNSGDPQIRFTESSGVDWTMGVESNVFEIVDGNALSGTSRLEISTTGATFGGTVAASNLSGTNTGDQSAASILTAIKTVDGAGSGLDADTVDGISSASFLRSDTADTSSQRITFTACATNNWDTIATASGSQGGLEVQNSGAGNDAFMTFHAGADFALYFGLDADINDIAVGGWSMGANKYRIWHAGNDGSGSGLDADLLKGLASTTSNIVNTIPVRDGSGDIHARLLRQQYTGTTTTANYIMTQVSLGTGDNYLRACPMSSFRTTLYAGGIHVPGGGAVATNEAFGTGALASNTTGSGNTATGYQALYNETTASGLTAVGHKALEGNASAGHATQGTLNTGVGYEVLKDSATGYYNTGIGYQSLQHVDAGHSNIGVGVQALRFDSGGTTSGYQNIGVGFQTGFSLTTGYRNVMMGHLAGYAMTSAFENIAIGYDSGNDITDGYRNVTIGTSAGRLITTGDYNTIIGRAAGYDQTTASHNTAIGASAGANMTNGGNVFVGSGSGDGTTSGVNTAVGYQSLKTCTTGSLNTAIGYRAMDSLTTASNHTAVGTYAGLGSVPSSSAGNVWVGYDAGNGPVGSCTGIANVGIGHQCMTSHTAATAVTCVGYQAGLYLATANDSVGIGRNAMEGASTRLITGGSNVAVGPYAMRRAYTGVGNTSMGRSALHGQSATGTTGNYNVALGYEAGFDVSSGSYNVMTGYRAGNNITTGGTNTAIGTEAMYAATTAGSNVAVGRQALYALTDGLNNTAIGRNAADSTTSGDYNVAVGFQALDDNVTGSSKTAVGYQALQNDTGASLSTAVGYSALGGQTTGLYNVAIGHSAGGSVATNGDNVFVGTTTGIATTGSSNTMVGFQAGYDQTSGSNNLLLGRFAGRSSSPSGTITTGSNIVCLGDNSITALYCADTTISSSDARDKTDVEVFSAGLDFVKKLRPVTYRWDKRSKYLTEENDDLLSITPDGTHKESRQHLGFLAQEVEEIEKEFGYSQTKDSQLVVNTNEDDTAMGIKYERLVPVLVNAIKELSAEIENLKSQLNQS
jgi:hypothetical protein